MTFEESKKEILQFFSPLNVERIDIFKNMRMNNQKDFILDQLNLVEKLLQTQEDYIERNVSKEFLRKSFLDFLNVLKDTIYNRQHSDNFRKQQQQIQEFTLNYIKILDDQIYFEEKKIIERQQKDIIYQVERWYSLFDLIDEQKRQQENLHKWNDFRPQGFDIQPHLLEIMFEKVEKGDIINDIGQDYDNINFEEPEPLNKENKEESMTDQQEKQYNEQKNQ